MRQLIVPNEQTDLPKFTIPRLKQSNLKHRIQEEIGHYIHTNKLEPGAPLPTEREFSEMLGISRTVIREALNGLELFGLVETRQGVGRFVGKINVSSMMKNLMYSFPASPESFRDLIEIRITLETSFILRNLDAFTAKDIKELRKCIDLQKSMIEAGCDESSLIIAHAEFHSKLVQHSQNKLLTDIINLFSQVQTRLYWEHKYKTSNREEYCVIHASLIDAIETKQVQVVKASLNEHFLEPLEWVRKSGISFSIPLELRNEIKQ